jgi:hypothetical protein
MTMLSEKLVTACIQALSTCSGVFMVFLFKIIDMIDPAKTARGRKRFQTDHRLLPALPLEASGQRADNAGF